MFSAGVWDRLQNPLEFILLAFRTIKLARAASQRRKKRAVGRTEGVKRGRVDIWKWSSFETPVAHQTLSLYLFPLFLSVSYCGFGSLSLRGGAFTGAFPSCLAVDFLSVYFLADWLESSMFFVTHSCLSVCYIFANKYAYKWVFYGSMTLTDTLCLCIQTLQAVVISETSWIAMYTTWAWMWVSLHGLTGVKSGFLLFWECIFIIGDLYIS